jgi:hypothetical protein
MNHKNLQKKSRIVAKDTRDYLIVDAETHNGFNEAIAPTGSPAEETEESKILAENSPPNSSLSPPASPSSPLFLLLSPDTPLGFAIIGDRPRSEFVCLSSVIKSRANPRTSSASCDGGKVAGASGESTICANPRMGA